MSGVTGVQAVRMSAILGGGIRLRKSIICISYMNGIDINYADFRRYDLNLLVAFDALLAECHVGRAAERLFIGQPAMSHALARLRELFDDELFVRTGRRMEPTARALALGPRVRAWLHEGIGFLGEASFDPARAEGLIRLAIPDGLEALFMPPLLARLRSQAPGVGIRVQLLEVEQLLAALDDDELDLAVVAVELPLRSWHQHEVLLRSGFNYLFCRRHLRLSRSASLAQLAACDHVISSYRGEAASVVDKVFAEQGLNRHVVASMASMVAVVNALKQAALVSIQPDLYAGVLDLSGLTVAPLRTDPPIGIQVSAVWHNRYDGEALHHFVREQIRQVVALLN
jgi:DNA-binding transcriptional LysR family regulator